MTNDPSDKPFDTNRWYKDRDFPEVKASNSDIIAVVERPKELQRVIDEHNNLLAAYQKATARIKRLEAQIDNLNQTISEMEYGASK